MKKKEVIEGYYALKGGEFEEAGEAAKELRTALSELGASKDDIKRVAVSSFEAEMNVLIHALAGTLRYVVDNGEVRITVTDMGPGIKDVEKAMQKGFSTAPEWAREKGWGSGLGLPNIKDNSDSLTIDTVPGEGTTINIVVRLKEKELADAAK
jgi:anti-sigma regulatory factor (Ser/Thr protein kinase)